MGRWEPDAAQRLHTAALELFSERGFTDVTVPEIAARAGLTTRSYFRHFADKREVLFVGEEGLPDAVVEILRNIDPALPTMDALVSGLRQLAEIRFDGLRDYLRARRVIVRSDEGLQERELRKLALVEDAAAIGFRERGMVSLEALLTARLAVAIFHTALDEWIDGDGSRTLPELIGDAASTLNQTLTTPGR